MLHESALAKINLYLHVGGRRADGYHALESFVCFVEAGDSLDFEPAPDLVLEFSGPFATALQGETDNLILRAGRALAAAAGRPLGARIHLRKSLPVASGIGGGSADAAATLRGLCRLWHLSPSPDQLARTALALGSDVPVCLASRPAQMSGRGEAVQAVRGLPAVPLLLVNPGVAVSTAAVFARLGRHHDACPPDAHRWSGATSADELATWLRATRNDMQDAACGLAPAIQDVLTRLEGCGAKLARMCGSGATCYGLFDDAQACAAAAEAIAATEQGWWVCPTRIASGV